MTYGSSDEQDSGNAFHDFIESDLQFNDTAYPFDHAALVPDTVAEAGWERYLQRLDVQVQALAEQPAPELWEESLRLEHQAIIPAVIRHFPPPAQLRGEDWPEVLHLITTLTLHIDATRSKVLELDDIFPYLDFKPLDALLAEDDDDEDDEEASILLGNLRDKFTHPAPRPVPRPQRLVYTGTDLWQLCLISGIIGMLLWKLLSGAS